MIGRTVVLDLLHTVDAVRAGYASFHPAGFINADNAHYVFLDNSQDLVRSSCELRKCKCYYGMIKRHFFDTGKQFRDAAALFQGSVCIVWTKPEPTRKHVFGRFLIWNSI